jgi:hypothetical protein
MEDMGVEMTKPKLLTAAALALMSLLLFSGCKKNQKTYDADSVELTLNHTEGPALQLTTQKWHITNKRVCVLFGYDFNNPEIKESLMALLKENFGLDEDGGLIYPLTYPDDFKHGVKGYASDFAAILQADNLDLCGVVLLGAPENTHIALARNQDKWEQEVPYPVIALFPQDDVLGIESTCDIVVDKGQTAGLAGEIAPEESDGQIHANAPEIIVETIKYIQLLDGAPSRSKELQKHMEQMLEGYQFHHYTDPESGLMSINHFVLNN